MRIPDFPMQIHPRTHCTYARTETSDQESRKSNRKGQPSTAHLKPNEPVARSRPPDLTFLAESRLPECETPERKHLCGQEEAAAHRTTGPKAGSRHNRRRESPRKGGRGLWVRRVRGQRAERGGRARARGREEWGGWGWGSSVGRRRTRGGGFAAAVDTSPLRPARVKMALAFGFVRYSAETETDF